MEGFALDLCLRLYTGRKFDILLRLSPKVAEVLEKEGVFHLHWRTSFSFVRRYPASKVALRFDWSVVDGIDWMPFTLDTGEDHSIDAHDYNRTKTTNKFE